MENNLPSQWIRLERHGLVHGLVDFNGNAVSARWLEQKVVGNALCYYSNQALRCGAINVFGLGDEKLSHLWGQYWRFSPRRVSGSKRARTETVGHDSKAPTMRPNGHRPRAASSQNDVNTRGEFFPTSMSWDMDGEQTVKGRKGCGHQVLVRGSRHFRQNVAKRLHLRWRPGVGRSDGQNQLQCVDNGQNRLFARSPLLLGASCTKVTNLCKRQLTAHGCGHADRRRGSRRVG